MTLTNPNMGDVIPVGYPTYARDLAVTFRRDYRTLLRTPELERLPSVGRDVRFTAKSVMEYAARRGYGVRFYDLATGRPVDPTTGELATS